MHIKKGMLLCTTIHTDVVGACFVFAKALIALIHHDSAMFADASERLEIKLEEDGSFDGLVLIRELLQCTQCNTMRSRLQVVACNVQSAALFCGNGGRLMWLLFCGLFIDR